MTSPGTPTADVSVVIPTYRRADRCRAAVASALEQTRAPREVVLVVDGPHDPDYDDFEATVDDPRLVVVRTGRPNGAAEARNIGVRTAQSSWIAFLDDDDVFLPAKIERQLGAIEAANLLALGRPIVSTTATIAVRGDRVERWPGRPPLADEPVEDFFFGLGEKPTHNRVLSTCTLLVSRELLLEVPMRGRAFDDWDWQIRASKRATRHHLDEVLTSVEMGADGLTASTTFEDGRAWIESIRPFISEAAYAAACLTVLGRLAGDKGTAADAVRTFIQAARHGGRARQLLEFAPRVMMHRVRRHVGVG
jgi:glycosyltransferase involved in cell wall biosynthesis